MGFTIDSARMDISLTAQKMRDIRVECCRSLQDKVTTIHKLARLVGHKSCSSPSSPSGTENRRSSPIPLTRICSDSEHSGLEMVDRSSHQTEWQTNNAVSSNDGNRVRRFKLGLGGMLQQPYNRGIVVCLRDLPFTSMPWQPF